MSAAPTISGTMKLARPTPQGRLPASNGGLWAAWLLQTFQVRDQRVDILVAEVQVRHERAGLDGLGVVQPFAQVIGRIRQGVGRDVRAAADVGQVRTNL